MRTRLKICCIADAEELRLAVAAGADAVGLVGPMPSGPGPIPLERASELARLRSPGVPSLSSSSPRSADVLAREMETVRRLALRIVHRLGGDVPRALRDGFPSPLHVQPVHVEGREALEEARAAAEAAQTLLLDRGRPTADPPELEGIGRPHDRRLARAIVEAVCFGVDFCSGVRRAGRLDADRLSASARAVATAPGIGAAAELGAPPGIACA